MIDLLLLLLFLTCIGITGAWVAENPGHVVIHWFDYRIDTSFAFLLLLAITVVAVLTFAGGLLRRLILLPSRLSEERNLRHYRKGMVEITYSVAALAAADVRGAELHTRKAEKLMGQTPLTLLLSAQIARSQGDESKTRAMLEEMLGHAETEYLAARSLSDAASKQQQLPRALSLAERAQAINPKEKAPVHAVISLHVRLGQWQEALLAVNKAVRRGSMSRNDMRHYRSIIYLQQGLPLLASHRYDAAMAAARAALRETPDFLPAQLFSARAFAGGGQQEKALKLILRAWKKTPHPQLSDTFRSIVAAGPKERQAKLMKKWSALYDAPPRSDAAWVCGNCGQPAAEWSAHCPSCQAFDTLEWKKRELKFAA